MLWEIDFDFPERAKPPYFANALTYNFNITCEAHEELVNEVIRMDSGFRLLITV